MVVDSFKEFTGKSKKLSVAAGVAITFEGKVLLVHPTGASWKTSAVGIPKGGIQDGEDILTAAIRELKEETGILLSREDLLKKEMQSVDKYNSKGDIIQVLNYYIFPIKELSEIGMTSLKVDKSSLQLEEIDWAGFININDAYPLIHRGQLIILDRLK
jgi:8-oxo-dGTP pyrophosphatase MutT (NUDIX family)